MVDYQNETYRQLYSRIIEIARGPGSGVNHARQALRAHGGIRLRDIPEHNYQSLLDALNGQERCRWPNCGRGVPCGPVIRPQNGIYARVND